MSHRVRILLVLLAAGALAGPPSVCAAAEASEVLNLPPTAQQWADLAKHPDFSGVWIPDARDQIRQAKTNPPPWNDKAGAVVKFQGDEMQAGRPINFFSNCLPEGMPAWMLISHNAMEFAFTPGKIYMLGESDSNRLRRIYTDGRPHPDDPDPTFHGHSIGHWEGDTLVIDTVGIAPQTFLAIGEAQGVPNNGDVHVVERIRLSGPDALDDTLTITAPHVLTKPWVTTRKWNRTRRRDYDIVEGVCLEAAFHSEIDKDGNAI